MHHHDTANKKEVGPYYYIKIKVIGVLLGIYTYIGIFQFMGRERSCMYSVFLNIYPEIKATEVKFPAL